MKIQELSFTPAVQVDQSLSPWEVAFAMRKNNADCVVVTCTTGESARARPVGVVTERDLAIFMLDDIGDASDITVGELLNGELATIDERGSASQAIELMNRYNVHRLPVTRSDGSLTGILTVDDLLRILAQANAQAVDWPLQRAG